MLNAFIFAVGVGAIMWFVAGLILFAFGATIYVHPRAPFVAKVKVVLVMSAIMPWHMLVHQHWPIVSLVPTDDPEAMHDFGVWWAKRCGCPTCKANLRSIGEDG